MAMNDFHHSFADEESHDGFLDGVHQETNPVGEALSDEATPVRDTTTVAKEESNTGPIIDSEGTLATEKVGNSVYIANLQWWTTDADVERLCAAYGPVVNIQFLAERSNGKSKGVALVEFTDSQAAVRCKEGLSGFEIHGKKCVVTFPNQSFQRSYGNSGSSGGGTNTGGGGRYGYGGYERGRMGDNRGRGRHGRNYNTSNVQNMHEMRPGMHMMNEMPGYMHDMGMMDMNSEVMGMPPMDGQMMGSHGPSYNMPPPPYPMSGGYMPEDPYEQYPYVRRPERFEKGSEGEDIAQKRQRPN